MIYRSTFPRKLMNGCKTGRAVAKMWQFNRYLKLSIFLDLFKVTFFTLYQGKPPSNHPLGGYFFYFFQAYKANPSIAVNIFGAAMSNEFSSSPFCTLKTRWQCRCFKLFYELQFRILVLQIVCGNGLVG